MNGPFHVKGRYVLDRDGDHVAHCVNHEIAATIARALNQLDAAELSSTKAEGGQHTNAIDPTIRGDSGVMGGAGRGAGPVP
jgi:hypothetical protein